jgi:hypothetical protein
MEKTTSQASVNEADIEEKQRRIKRIYTKLME